MVQHNWIGSQCWKIIFVEDFYMESAKKHKSPPIYGETKRTSSSLLLNLLRISKMTLTCISVYCVNRRLSTATNTAMLAIKPKQTEQNASLNFIMESDFDLKNTKNWSRRKNWHQLSANNCYVLFNAMNWLKIPRLPAFNTKIIKWQIQKGAQMIRVNTVC